MAINSRVQREGAPYPPDPGENANPRGNITTFVGLNEAKRTPDIDKFVTPSQHPTMSYDGSGGRAHRVSSGVKRA